MKNYRYLERHRVTLALCAVVGALLLTLPSPAGARALPQVKGLTLTKVSSTSLKVSWSSVSGASGYELWRTTASSTGTYSRIKRASYRSYANAGLGAGKVYYYKVRAYRVVSGKNAYGTFSTIKGRGVQPVFGWAYYSDGELWTDGLGTVRPKSGCAGGDPTTCFYSTTWASWGGSTAIGHGAAVWDADSDTVADAPIISATVVGWDPGIWRGHYIYREAGWYFPTKGETLYDLKHDKGGVRLEWSATEDGLF